MTQPGTPAPVPPAVQPVYISVPQPKRSTWRAIVIYVAVVIVVFSVLFNLVLIGWVGTLAGTPERLQEVYIEGSPASASRVAVVSITGVIEDSSGRLFMEGGNYRFVMKQLKQAREDDRVVSVILEVNSPGGGVTESDIILHEVERLKAAKKRVVVWMRNLAASGGYYVSCKADEIFACPTTITGSIGVIAILPNVQGLEDKIGVRPVVLKCGEFKDMGSPFRDMTPEEQEKFQGLLNQAWARFKKLVVEGRAGKISATEIDKIANGSVYTADQALENKLIDRIGYFEDAVASAKGGRKDVAVFRYQQMRGLLSLLSAKSSDGDIHVHFDSPLDTVKPGLHYLWLPGAGQ